MWEGTQWLGCEQFPTAIERLVPIATVCEGADRSEFGVSPNGRRRPRRCRWSGRRRLFFSPCVRGGRRKYGWNESPVERRGKWRRYPGEGLRRSLLIEDGTTFVDGAEGTEEFEVRLSVADQQPASLDEALV